MSVEPTLAIDAMGGDHGPSVTIPAARQLVDAHPGLHVLLVGDQTRIRAELERYGSGIPEGIAIRHCSQVVAMDEPPAQSLRTKRDSSMRVAIDAVRAGDADACVSAGNTGALMANARYVLKTLEGIDRPAICAPMPTRRGRTHMLDLGANVDCEAAHLHQFATMGSRVAAAVDGIAEPRVALLNVGSEAIKGTEQVKQAADLLEASSLHYVGYIEGDGIYTGAVDVVVSDGFVGNIALKTSEGVARMIGRYLRDEFEQGVYSRIAGLLAAPVLRRFKQRIDPRGYNGASFVGLRGVVVKSHGGADAMAFANAVRIARLEAIQKLPNRIAEHVEPQGQAKEIV